MKLIAIIIIAALVAAGGNLFKAKPVETELGEWSVQALRDNALDWPRVEMDGRDAYIYGEAPDRAARQQTLSVVDDVWGIRRAHDRMTLSGDQEAEADEAVTDPGDADETPQPVARLDNADSETAGLRSPSDTDADISNSLPADDASEGADDMAGSQDGETVDDSGTPDDSALANTEPATSDPAPSVQAVCQSEFDAAISEENVQFAFNSAQIDPASYVLLDRIVEIATNCPDGMLEVGGHTDNVGTAEANRGVSARRAQSVAAYLIASGIPETRVVAVGYGLDVPIASNDNEEGRAINRRVEFTLLDEEE